MSDSVNVCFIAYLCKNVSVFLCVEKVGGPHSKMRTTQRVPPVAANWHARARAGTRISEKVVFICSIFMVTYI